MAGLGAALGFIIFACGTDNQSSPNPMNIPTSSVCPGTKVHPLAISGEDLAVKQPPAMTIALTFDSGPSEATSTLSTYLKSEQVKATFFITGENVTDDLKATLTQLSSDGHLIGNRGNTDEDLSKLTSDALVKSVTDTDTLIGSLTPAGKLYFRPPYGAWSTAAGQALAASPMNKYIGPVVWDIGDSLDQTTDSDQGCFAPETGDPKTPQQCGDLFLAQIRAKKQGIVLMHDGPPGTTGDSTSSMVEYMIPILKNEGYKFARLDELQLVPETTLETGDDDGDGGVDPSDDGGVIQDPVEDPCKTP